MAGLRPFAGFLIFWDPEFRLLVLPVASLPLPAVAAVGVPLFHLFCEVLAGLDFGLIKCVAVFASNTAANGSTQGIDTVSEWLDMVWYHVREPDGKGGCENHLRFTLLEKHSCFDGAGGNQRLFIDVFLAMIHNITRSDASTAGVLARISFYPFLNTEPGELRFLLLTEATTLQGLTTNAPIYRLGYLCRQCRLSSHGSASAPAWEQSHAGMIQVTWQPQRVRPASSGA